MCIKQSEGIIKFHAMMPEFHPRPIVAVGRGIRTIGHPQNLFPEQDSIP